MKKLTIFSVLLSCTTFSWAFNPPDASLTMTSDSRTVTLSTTIASPTQLVSKDPNIQRTWLINSSTCSVFISSVSTGITYSSTAIPGNGASTNLPVIFSPDGVNSPYAGQIFGVSNCATPPTLVIFRTK